MHTKLKLLAALAALPFAGCTTTEPPSAAAGDATTLVAAKVGTPPTLDGDANDAAWRAAKPLTVKIFGGENFKDGESTATLKAVTSGDSIYFLIQYDDPTESLRRGPFVKQADGSWKKLSDPKNKGGDDNMYYEDKWSIIWNIDNSIAGFNQQGCMVYCHLGEGKPYGNKYTEKAGELGDMWHHKGQRVGVWGFVDDQYVDHTRYDPKASPNAGRKGDPGGPDYRNVALKDGKPEFMNPDGKPGNKGGRYFIKDGEQVAFQDRFQAGDEVASYIVNQLKGDRADVKVAYKWRNGKWTNEVSRKLTTGSKFDVQFNDPNKAYYFGFAAFDNAQVRHSVSGEPLKLVFAK